MERMLQSDEYVVNLLFLLRFVECAKSAGRIAKHGFPQGLAHGPTADDKEQESR